MLPLFVPKVTCKLFSAVMYVDKFFFLIRIPTPPSFHFEGDQNMKRNTRSTLSNCLITTEVVIVFFFQCLWYQWEGRMLNEWADCTFQFAGVFEDHKLLGYSFEFYFASSSEIVNLRPPGFISTVIIPLEKIESTNKYFVLLLKLAVLLQQGMISPTGALIFFILQKLDANSFYVSMLHHVEIAMLKRNKLG